MFAELWIRNRPNIILEMIVTKANIHKGLLKLKLLSLYAIQTV